MRPSSWQSRIERAAELESEYPAAAEVLRFYQEIAKFQSESEPLSQKSGFLESRMPALIALVGRIGPPALVEAANRPGVESHEPAVAFFTRVLLQVQKGYAAAHSHISMGITRNTCPFCNERPVAAVLRPEGEGGKRGLVCSLCFTEWEFRRLLCPNCGEEDHRKLPVYTASEFPYIRIETCDSCRRYIKSVDLTINGRAIPEVDELAAIPLDLWAVEKDYTKLTPNIFGL
jgi:FdhE protein